MNDKEKVDEYHAQVYEMGGGVVTNWDGKQLLYAAVSLPGITTKYEPIDAAMVRLRSWIDNRGKSNAVDSPEN